MKRWWVKIILISLFVLGGLNVFCVAKASFNEQINYQGKITDSSNQAISDGDHCFKFRIMDALTNGNQLWSEEWDAATSKITTTSGLFSVLLGSYQPLSSVKFNQESIYLEVQYDPDSPCDDNYQEVFSPRKRMGTVPAAFEAKKLGGYTWAWPDAIGATTPSTGAFTTFSASGIVSLGQTTITSTSTPQLTVKYDGSYYYTTSVSNAGTISFDATGASSAFGFADNVGIGTTTKQSEALYVAGNAKVTGTGTFASLGTFSTAPNANYGLYASLSGTGKYGVYNYASVLFGETQYGLYNYMTTQSGSTTSSEYIYGIKQDLYSQGNLSSGYSYVYAMYNDIRASGYYTLDEGIHNNWTITGQSTFSKGFYDTVSSGGTSGGTHTGYYSYIADTSTGRTNTGFSSSIAPNAATNTATNFSGEISIYQTDTTAKVGSFSIASSGAITNPSNLQVAVYVSNNIQDTDTGFKKWAFYNASTNTTAGKVFMGIDSVPTYWGTGFDASILFDADSLNIKSNLITATDSLELTGGTNGILLIITATGQVKLTDGVFAPVTTNDIDLGTTALRFKNIYQDDNAIHYFGIAQDASIVFDANSLNIKSNLVTATDSLEFTGGTNGIKFIIAATEQIKLTDGVFAPTTTNDIDLGTSSLKFKNAYFSGTGTFGSVAIGATTPQSESLYVAGNARVTGFGEFDGGILSVGTSTGYTIPSGAGTRLMWIPAKGAFRAGTVDAADWDSYNIGDNSFAVGRNAKAIGTGSIATGSSTIAGSDEDGYAIAMGSSSEATTFASIAMGNYAVANGGSVNASIGEWTLANGEVSAAMGYYTTSSGKGSFSVGLNENFNSTTFVAGTSSTIGKGAIALGYATSGKTLTATGDGSIAIGQDVNATTNNNVIAIGENFTNTTDSSFAVGFGGIDLLITSGSANFQDTALTTTGNGFFGSVAIGATTPQSEALYVSGNAKVTGTITSGNSIVINGVTDTITASSGTISFDNENLTTTGNINGNDITSTSTDTARTLGFDTNTSSLAAIESNTAIYIKPSATLVGWFSSSQFGFYDDKDFQFGSGGYHHTAMRWGTAQTNDALVIGADDYDGTSSRSIIIADDADRTYNFAHTVQSNPTLFIHSAAQSTTQWLSFAHNQTDGVITTGAGDLSITATGGDINFGDDNLTTTGTGKFANLGTFNATPNANYGLYASLSGTGKYGIYNYGSVLFGETQYGLYNVMYTQAGSTTAAEYIYGIKQALYSEGDLSSGYSYAYGMWNDFYISGIYTLDTGIYNNWSITGQASYTYGFEDIVSSSGTSGGSHNAFYSGITDTSTGRTNTGFSSSITPNAATNTATNFLGTIYIYQTDTIAKVASFTISAGTITNPSNFQVATYVANNISGTDTGNKKWAFYNASTNTTAGKVFLGLDSTYTYWGTGYDAYIGFDSDSLNIASNLITATDSLEFTGGTNGIKFIITATEQIKLTDGVLAPTTTNDIDLGTASLLFKNAYFKGAGTFGSVAIGATTPQSEALYVAGDAKVTGIITGTFNNITIGDGTASDARTLTFDSVNDGTFTWNNTSDYLGFNKRFIITGTSDSYGRMLSVEKTNIDLSTGNTKQPFTISAFASTGGSKVLYGTAYDIRYTGTQAQTGSLAALQGQMYHTGAGATSNSYIMNFGMYLASNANASIFAGGYVGGYVVNTYTGTIGTYYGYWDYGVNPGTTGSVTTAYNFYGGAHTAAVGGTFTNAYGMVLAKQTAGSTINAGLVLLGDSTSADIANCGSSIVFGEGKDAAISYDGTDLIINPKIVGTGKLKQLYDISNYYTISVSSAGTVSFDATGASAAFGFADNVGVGTTTKQSEALYVSGNAKVTGTITSGNSIVINGVTDTITASSGTISFDNENLTTTGTGTLGKLVVNTSDLVVNAASYENKVGIGTATPAEKLSLSGGNFLHTAGTPTIKSTINDDTNLYNAQSVYVSGKYAYVVDNDTDGGRANFAIIDISNPSSPSIVGTLNDDTNLNNAYSVYVSGKYAYVANNNISGSYANFAIIDISNPYSPSIAGTINDDTNLYYAQSVYVSGKYAYVACHNDNSGSYRGLVIYDISNPSSPSIAGTVQDAGNLYNASQVSVFGNYAYVTTESYSASKSAFTIVNVSNPFSPSVVGYINENTNNGTNVYVSGKYAYTCWRDLGNSRGECQVINVSNPASPSITNTIYDSTNLPNPEFIYVSGRYAYVVNQWSVGSASNFAIIDISNPSSLSIAGAIDDDTNLYNPSSIYVSGKYAYVVDNDTDGGRANFAIVDISGIDAPAATIGDLAVGTIDVWENMDVKNNLSVGGGLNVGPRGIYSYGEVGIANASNASSLTVLNNTTLTATVQSITANALTTGIGLSITNGTSAMTTGSLLKVAASGTGTINTNGIVSITHAGIYSSTSNFGLLSVQANSTTAGTIQNISGTALTTGVGLYIANGTSAMTSGSLLRVTASGTGTIATSGIVSITHGGVYSSTSNVGVLSVQANSTTGGTVANFQANALTTGVNLYISSTGTGLTSGSLLVVTSSTTGAIASNGIVSFNAGGAYTSPANVGLLNVTANSTTAGTVAKFSGIALTTGQILNLTSGTGLTTGSALVLTGASYKHASAETGNLVSISFTDASTHTTGTATTNGLNIASTYNSTSVGAKAINGVFVIAPTLVACGTTGGSCSWNGYKTETSALTQSTTNAFTMNGFLLSSAGALVQNTVAGTINWNGLNVQMPNITQTTGAVTATGIKITGGTVTSGTAYGLDIAMAGGTQARIGYNTSNYYTQSVSSAGTVSFDATGASAAFGFADNVGVGTTTKQSEALYVAGDAKVTGTGTFGIGRFTTGIYDNAGTPIIAIDTTNRRLTSADGTYAMVNWGTGQYLADDSNHSSVDWKNRWLYDTAGSTVMLDWSSGLSTEGYAGVDDTYDDGSDTTITFTNGLATGISTAFNESLVKDISPLAGVLPDIDKIRVLSYKWNEKGLAQFPTDKSEDIVYGFLAEDFEQYYPYAVTDKKGEDTYNRNVVQVIMMKAIQELNEKIKSLELQLSLNNNGSVGDGDSGVTNPLSLLEKFISLGVQIKEGVVWFKELAVEKITANEFVAEKITANIIRTDKIEMVDRVSGDVYCSWVEGGELKRVRGECSTIQFDDQGDSVQIPAINPAPEPTPEVVITPTPEPTTEPTPTPTPTPEPTTEPTPEATPEPTPEINPEPQQPEPVPVPEPAPQEVVEPLE